MRFIQFFHSILFQWLTGKCDHHHRKRHRCKSAPSSHGNLVVSDMRHDALFVYDRRVYKLAGGLKQVWNAFMVAVPGLDVFARAMDKIAANVADRRHFYHSLYYTGPALLYESIADGDSIEFRWRVQHRDALSAASRRVADVRTDEEVLLHFKLPRATKHYSEMSRGGDIYAS